MGEILGLGMTHYPPLAGRDENMSGILRGTLRDPAIPAELKEPANWPKLMQEEWGTDQGKAKAAGHREALLSGLAKIRAALDEFKPDFVVIWGDDQYENFTDDIIPPFCILAYDNIEAMPWRLKAPGMPGGANVWSEREDFVLNIRGHREGGKRARQRPDHGRLRCLLLLPAAASAGRRPCVPEFDRLSRLSSAGLRPSARLLFRQLLRTASHQLPRWSGEIRTDSAAGTTGSAFAVAGTLLRSWRGDGACIEE